MKPNIVLPMVACVVAGCWPFALSNDDQILIDAVVFAISEIEEAQTPFGDTDYGVFQRNVEGRSVVFFSSALKPDKNGNRTDIRIKITQIEKCLFEWDSIGKEGATTSDKGTVLKINFNNMNVLRLEPGEFFSQVIMEGPNIECDKGKCVNREVT